MPRPHRSLASSALLAGWLVAGCPGCSFHASYETSTGESQRKVRAPRASAPSARNDRRTRPAAGDAVTPVPIAAPPAHGDGSSRREQDEAKRTEQRRRRQAEADAALERETRERVAQAEREAAEQERAAEAEAERARKQAAEAHKPAAASGEGRTLLHRDPDPSLPTGTARREPADRLTLVNREISKTELEKKAVIRKRLEQNKADILVAAERKRNEIHAQLKDDAEHKP